MRLLARLFAVAAALVAAQGCTQASTSLAGPSSSKCQITATNQPSSFPAGGGRGSVSIGATRDCAWAIAANAPWIAIAGERSGRGDGVVNYTVSENSVPSARSAALTIEDLQLPLSQAAAPCTFSIAPAGRIGGRGRRHAFVHAHDVDRMPVERGKPGRVDRRARAPPRGTASRPLA